MIAKPSFGIHETLAHLSWREVTIRIGNVALLTSNFESMKGFSFYTHRYEVSQLYPVDVGSFSRGYFEAGLKLSALYDRICS